jgi:hypothetical protein
MPNEQCGLCWDLEFDKKGNKTHEDFRKHHHDFVKFDYCLQCREPKFDQYGFQTHTAEIDEMLDIQKAGKDHNFISGIETKRKKQKLKYHFLEFFGFGIIGVFSTIGILNLFF